MNLELYTKHVKFTPVDGEENRNCNAKICASCGKCCASSGCEISADDIDQINVDTIIDMLNSGAISIDAWEGEHRIFFLRIRNKNSNIADFMYGSNPCILLTDKGCKFEYRFRGKTARELIPKSFVNNYTCTSNYNKEDAAKSWIPYQNIIKEAANKLNITLPKDDEMVLPNGEIKKNEDISFGDMMTILKSQINLL